MKFPPNWSMETILILALAVAVIVVIFAQAGPGDRTRFSVERSEQVQMVREVQPSFRDDAPLGR
jgi:hypothetical protein